MSITWAELRDQVRTGILEDFEDAGGEFAFSDEKLLIAVGWALDRFAEHTAEAASTSFAADGKVYELPDDLFDAEPLDTTGMVYIEREGCETKYLEPIMFSPLVSIENGEGFYTYPPHILNLTSEPDEESTVHVWYFKYYDHPTDDEDVIAVPRWSHKALAYLIASDALSGPSLESADIRQFADKRDLGNPEHNPMLRQQKHFLELAERELARRPVQDRTGYFKRDSRY